MFVTMCREAYDDSLRFRRDREVNSQLYQKLTKKGPTMYYDFICTQHNGIVFFFKIKISGVS